MAVHQFPDTQVAIEMLTPQHARVCEIFYESSPANKHITMGSVNAGTSYSGSLFEVGQEGMIGAFYGILSAQQGFIGKHPYQKIHKHLHRIVGENQHAILEAPDVDSPIQFAMIQKPAEDAGCIDFDGMVFIDVFKDHLRPYEVDANYAMIYIVPPMGDLYERPDNFLSAIEATAENIVRTVENYNRNYTGDKSPNALNLKQINTVRICLFSGGYFNTFHVSHRQIAHHIYHGLVSGLQGSDTGIGSIQFENNYYEVVENEIIVDKQDFDSLKDLF